MLTVRFKILVNRLSTFLATHHCHLVITSCQALRNGHGDWTDGALGSDGADSLSEDDFSFFMQAENIVDKSERALAQASALLETATALNPALGGYSGANADAGGNISEDGPSKKRVCKSDPLGACPPPSSDVGS